MGKGLELWRQSGCQWSHIVKRGTGWQETRGFQTRLRPLGSLLLLQGQPLKCLIILNKSKQYIWELSLWRKKKVSLQPALTRRMIRDVGAHINAANYQRTYFKLEMKACVTEIKKKKKKNGTAQWPNRGNIRLERKTRCNIATTRLFIKRWVVLFFFFFVKFVNLLNSNLFADSYSLFNNLFTNIKIK